MLNRQPLGLIHPDPDKDTARRHDKSLVTCDEAGVKINHHSSDGEPQSGVGYKHTIITTAQHSQLRTGSKDENKMAPENNDDYYNDMTTYK